MKFFKSLSVLTFMSFLLVTLLSVPVFPEDPWDVDDTNGDTNGDAVSDTTNGGSDGGTLRGIGNGYATGFNVSYFSRLSFSLSYEIAKFLFGATEVRYGSSLMTTGQTDNAVRTGYVAKSSK